MGLSSKKQTNKTTTQQNTSMTTTPTNPTYVTEGIEGLAGQIKNVFGGIDPSKWTPGSNPLQTQAAGMAAGLGNFLGYNGGGQTGAAPQGGSADPFIDGMNISRGVAGVGANTYDPTGYNATGYNAQTGQAASLYDDIQKGMNPYLKEVRQASLADFDHGAGQQMAQANLDLANDTTFGGSGGSLYKSALGGEIARGRGALSANLNADAFRTAADLAATNAGMRQQMNLANLGAQNTASQFNAGATNAADAFNAGALNVAGQFNSGQRDTALNRQLNAAAQTAGLGAARDANSRANIGTQYDVGSGQRDIETAQNRSAADQLMAQIAAFTGLPLDLLRGSTSTGTMDGTSTSKSKTSGASLGDWLGYFAANAQAAARTAGGGG